MELNNVQRLEEMPFTRHYEAFGCRIRSEIALPELSAARGEASEPDITIRVTAECASWPELAEACGKLEVETDRIAFRIEELAVFIIREGRDVEVRSLRGADEDRLRLYILGTCMGAALMQRRVLPLHGSAIAIGGRAYAVVGESGSGKSTLAAAFLARGCRLLSDDVIAVSAGTNGIPMVAPAYPQQKLWQQSLDAFGMNAAGYRPLHERETKFAIPVQERFLNKPLPLGGVIELSKGGEQPQLRRVHGLSRVQLLYRHTYRNFLIHGSGLTEWHFKLTAGLSNKLAFYQMQRPETSFTAPTLVEMLLTEIGEDDRYGTNVQG
ncbi:HPr kinase/phosphorylase [Paenibacillus aurantiacus]|uniref:HPr kinase/phosphorylase n=1 Tax=Paenibacillus aurantiacus TaxID=1936118 RepID=A0ABV5KIQ9_9BACL